MSEDGTDATEKVHLGTDDYLNPVDNRWVEKKADKTFKMDDADFKKALVDLGLSAELTDLAFENVRNDLEMQRNDVSRSTPVEAEAAKDDDKTIDSVTIGAATSLGPVKLQLAYVDENGSEATDDKSPSLASVGFRVPVGSAEIRGHMTEVDPDDSMRDDNEAWGLLLMNDFGGGYFGMIGVGNYTDGGRVTDPKAAVLGGRYATKTRTTTADDAATTDVDESRANANILIIETADPDNAGESLYYNAETGDPITVNDTAGESTDGTVVTVHEDDIEDKDYVAGKKGVHKDAGDMTNLYVSLTKSFGGGLSATAEYSTTSTTVTEMDGIGDDKETTNKFLLSLIQTF